jgi:hypothetical protein
MPGTGGLVAAVETASGAKAVNVGKGGPWLFPFLCESLDLTPASTAVVGDRLDTDIAMARAGGMLSILPLTGAGRGGRRGRDRRARTRAGGRGRRGCRAAAGAAGASCGGSFHPLPTGAKQRPRVQSRRARPLKPVPPARPPARGCPPSLPSPPGVATLEDALAAPPSKAPDIIIDSVAALAGL